MLSKNNILAWAAAVFSVTVWAESFISTKILLNEGLEPSDIFIYRFTLAYILIWLISPKKLFCKSLKDELMMLALGVCGGSLYFLLENSALAYSTASNVAILVASSPLLTALLIGHFYKEDRLKGRQILGSVIAFVGMALVVLNGKFVLHLNPLGDSLALGASVVWAFYSLLIKKTSGRYDMRFVTRKVFFYGLVTMGLYMLLFNPLHVDMEILSRTRVWTQLLYLGIGPSLLCFVLWNWALEKLGAVRTTNLIYGQCFVTMVIAGVVLGEKITWMAVLGSLILVLGMADAMKK